MFGKLQWRLTLLHTLILVSILAATNLFIYFLLQSYNVSQISRDADSMVNTLRESAWITQSEAEEVPKTIEVETPEVETPEVETHEVETHEVETAAPVPASSGEESGKDVEKGDRHPTEGSGETPEESSKGKPESGGEGGSGHGGNRKEAETIVPEASHDESPSLPEPSDSEMERQEGASAPVILNEDRILTAGRTLTGSLPVIRLDTHKSPQPQTIALSVVNSVSGKPASTSGSGITVTDVRDLLIPSVLRSFSFYLVFDPKGNLISHNLGNVQTLDSLMGASSGVITGDPPVVRNLQSGPVTRALLLRRPIEINGVTYGTYLVGRDLSLVSETMSNLFRILVTGFLAGVLASILIGYLLAGRAIRPIREAYEAKQRFLADVSHDLRTPISVILLSSESLDRVLMPGQTDARSDLADIREETFRMRDQVERLLFLARSDSPKYAANKERVDISVLLAGIVASLEIMAGEKAVTLALHSPPGLSCRGDAKMLTSLFSSLIENAIKYNRPKGSVLIEGLETGRGKHCWLEVKITDTGIGIPAPEQGRIFQRFYRGNPSEREKADGHGLGLAIAKEIAEAHNGSIRVHSKPDEGSIFTVRLPV